MAKATSFRLHFAVVSSCPLILLRHGWPIVRGMPRPPSESGRVWLQPLGAKVSTPIGRGDAVIFRPLAKSSAHRIVMNVVPTLEEVFPVANAMVSKSSLPHRVGTPQAMREATLNQHHRPF